MLSVPHCDCQCQALPVIWPLKWHPAVAQVSYDASGWQRAFENAFKPLHVNETDRLQHCNAVLYIYIPCSAVGYLLY